MLITTAVVLLLLVVALGGHPVHWCAAYQHMLGPKATGGGKIRVLDRDGKERHVFREHAAPLFLGGIQFSPDDRLVLSSSRDGVVKIWETETGKVRWSFNVPLRGTGFIGSPGRQRFALGDSGRLVALPTEAGMKVVEFDHLRDLFSLEGAAEVYFSPDGHRLLSWHSKKTPLMARNALNQNWGGAGGEKTMNPGELKLWDVPAGKVLWSGPFNDLNGAFVFSPDARVFAITNSEREYVVEVRDATTGAKRFEVPSATAPTCAFNPDGTRLIVAAWETSTATPPSVWDTTTGKQLFRLEGTNGPTRCAYSPDGKRIATSDLRRGRGQVRLWDALTGRELLALSNPRANSEFSGTILIVDFSADGHRLVAPGGFWSTGSPETVWDATPRTELKKP